MMEEDVFHTMTCLNDHLSNWHANVEDLEAIFKDAHLKNLKETAIKIGNIVKFKNKPVDTKHLGKKYIS